MGLCDGGGICQCRGQALLTASIVICLSFIQFTHQWFMLKQFLVPSSRIILTQILRSHINAVLLSTLAQRKVVSLFQISVITALSTDLLFLASHQLPGSKAQVAPNSRSHTLCRVISLISPQLEARSTEQGTKLSFSGANIH